MSKRTELTTVGDVTIVRLKDSRLVDEHIIAELANDLRDLIGSSQHNKLLVNFAEVVFIGPVLNALIDVRKMAAKTKTGLGLCGISAEIMEVFEITKLVDAFDIHANEEIALAKLNR